MLLLMRAKFIALLMFPGRILHEISHRFFCDVTTVPVYAIRYFILHHDSKTGGCVTHEHTNSLRKAFLIGCGPLIINSIVCMVLTLPFGTSYVLGTDFIKPQSPMMNYAHNFVTWFGLCAGIYAMPSNQDIEQIIDLSNSAGSRLFTYPFISLVYIMNWNYLGYGFRACYAVLVACLVPFILL